MQAVLFNVFVLHAKIYDKEYFRFHMRNHYEKSISFHRRNKYEENDVIADQLPDRPLC